MTNQEFNEKYKVFLEEGFGGLEIDIPELTKWLDEKFEQFVIKPDFKFYQIKVKFGSGRFYCEGLTLAEIQDVEHFITELNKL